jgi:hypothetical protein
MNRNDPIALTANKATFLVLFDRPQEQLPMHMKVSCVEGQSLDARWIEQTESHYYLHFDEPVGGQFRWYAVIADWNTPPDTETPAPVTE